MREVVAPRNVRRIRPDISLARFTPGAGAGRIFPGERINAQVDSQRVSYSRRERFGAKEGHLFACIEQNGGYCLTRLKANANLTIVGITRIHR